MTQIGVVSQSGAINPVDLAFIVEAWDAQSREFCSTLEIPYVPVLLYNPPPEAQVGTGEVRLMTIQDVLSDAPGAEGYHDDVLGDIFARILANNNADSGSHECCEENLDPLCTVWMPMGDGREVAFESCDPVQGDSYLQDATIGDETVGIETRQVLVSNFVLRSWFDPNGKYPFDRMGKLTAPFQLGDGGYMIVRDARGDVTDVFAEPRVVHGGERGRLAAERKRARPDSRLSRRLRSAA